MALGLEYANDAFSFIFTLEFIIKLVGFGLNYFKDFGNIIDLIIVIMSWVDFLLNFASGPKLNSAIKLVRTFRIVRMMKFIRKLKELKRILWTFLNAIPELANVGGLLFLFLYLYAVVGVYLFSTVKLQNALNSYANF